MTTNTESLRDLLTARSGYQTYVATLGTNGNGGMLANIDDILSADEDDSHLDDYEDTGMSRLEVKKELLEHIRDAGGSTTDANKGNHWAAYDCDHTDSQGYLTGSVSRIYVNLSV